MMHLTEVINEVLSNCPQPGLAELRDSLHELLGNGNLASRTIGTEALVRGVYRLRIETNGATRSLIVKRLEPEIAKRNCLVAKRWLPAIGLGENGPPLLGNAAERNCRCVWQIYEDLGDWGLRESSPKPECVKAVVELVAKMHARFAGHPLLAECRLWGGELGTHFYSTSVRDAIISLERLQSPHVELSAQRTALRDRLLSRLHKLLDELPDRLQMVQEFGGPETMLHGDLWPQNAFVIPSPEGPRVRMIDWDHAGAGPVIYDLSTFLSRFPAQDRQWILDAYHRAPESPSWKAPSSKALNLIFETAECARLAYCVIWPAIEAGESQVAWAFDKLAETDEWFDGLAPLLPS
jgi:Phosphotransferase enzyme family